MVRTQKNRRTKRYQYDKNRKNMKKKLKSTGKIKCTEIKKEIDRKKSLVNNINEMGIVYNLKRKFTAPNYKKSQIEKYDPDSIAVKDTEEIAPRKKYVAEKLEKDAKELRESNFRLPKCQVKELSYFMDKYGLNYKQMIKDHKNYYQLTWRQFRQKIRKFMSIPEQFSKYLEERNLIEGELDESKWQEATSDGDD